MSISWRNPFSPVKRLCPVCGSPLKKLSALDGWFLPDVFVCEKCGYRGPLFVEVGEEDEQGQDG